MAKRKVRDNITGEVFEVDESELGNYGLSATTAPTLPTHSTQTGTPSATPSANQKYITGISLEEHAQALQRARAAADTAAIKEIQANYDTEFEYQKAAGGFKPEGYKKQAATLRKEFNTETKSLGFKEIQNSWNKVRNAQETGAGDLTIVYSYIKALDPTTAVREGEINLTKAAESIPSNIIRTYKRAKEGKVISPELRQEMINEIGRIYNEKARQQQQLNAFYSGLATDMGANPEDVIGGVGEIELAQISETPTEKEGIVGPAGLVVGGGKTLIDFLLPETKRVVTESFTRPIGGNITPEEHLAARGNVPKATELALRQTGEFVGRSFPPALELALLKGTGSLLKKVGGKILKTAGGVITRGPRGYLAGKQAQAAAKTTVKPAVEKIIDAGKQYVQNNPEAQRLFDIHSKTIKKIKDVPSLLERMKVWGQAYNNASAIKDTTRAQFFDSLYSAGRKEIAEKAPEVSQYRNLLSASYTIPREVSKKGYQALKFTALGRLLGF